jgi:Family of unknown function (DUF6328)
MADDTEWDESQRHETPLQRLDRNWADLLQELRVVQTGVQFLTGFLLTLPFQTRFSDLDEFARDVYLATVASAVVATGLLITPVSVHRLLFRRHARSQSVAAAHWVALAGLVLLGVAIVGVVLLIFDVVSGRAIGLGAAAVTLALLLALWLAFPWTMREHP